MGPYRSASELEVLEAPTRQGIARLEVAPRYTQIRVGDRTRLTVTDKYFTFDNPDSRRRKRKSMKLDGARLMVSRAVPTDEVSIWYEIKPDIMSRVFGVRPPQLLDTKAFQAWESLDRLYRRLREALLPHAGGAIRAREYGRGDNKVLVADQGDRYIIFVRPLFRERHRRAAEVHTSGEVLFPTSSGDDSVRCASRYAVTVCGNNINFADESGKELAHIWLPWIDDPDRVALARELGERVHQEPAR